MSVSRHSIDGERACPWIHLETWERPGSLRTGLRPSVTQAGEGLTAITCPWIQFGDVGEAEGVSLRSLHFGRCCGCLPLRWRATFDNSVCQPILAVSFLIHFLAARPAVFHCCCLFCLLLPFFACCCLFCHALCFCLASLFLFPVMWFEQLGLGFRV